MATPRKHWFRVADSVLHETWSNDVAATFMRLLAYLNTRWAREGRQGIDASSATLGPAMLCQCTGSQSLARARRILDELAAHVSLTVHRQGVATVISWPKSAIFQKWAPELGAEPETDAPDTMPPPQDAPAPAPARRREREETRAPRAPRVRVEGAWQEMTRALARHGRDPTALHLTPARERAIRSRLGEGFEPPDFGRAADGYRAMHGRAGSNGFDPDKHFTPDTLLRPSHFAKYVEAAQAQNGRRVWEHESDTPPPRMYT